MLTGLAPIKRIERTNAVMVHPTQQAVFTLQNPYAMEVDRGNKNCYNCGSFEHITRHCRNRKTEDRIGEGRRLEYRGNKNNKERRMIEE